MTKRERLLKYKHQTKIKKKEFERSIEEFRQTVEYAKHIASRKHFDLSLKEIYEGLPND